MTILKTTAFCLLAGAATVLAGQVTAQELDEVSFGTNWLAEGEHGGFYQAVADGTYEKYGLKVNYGAGKTEVVVLGAPSPRAIVRPDGVPLREVPDYNTWGRC